ncbi:hypothetical protein SELMODRAFT_90926, partial [Selaginella moellendorffii]
LRKATLVWKLLVLLLVAGCGVYMCLIGVDRRTTYDRLSLDPIQQVWRRENLCPRLSRAKFPQHYPQPRTYSRKECRCVPVHFFVLLSMQRSGSGWFETLLNSHPNVSSHGEIFSIGRRRANFSTIKQTLDEVYNLEWYSSAAKNECTAAVGFKWMLNQGALAHGDQVADYFRSRGVSVVFLQRRNYLKRLISVMGNAYDRAKPLNGTHVAHVHSREEAELLASFKPTIDVANLLQNLRRVQNMSDETLRIFGTTRLTALYYEDLVKNPRKVMRVDVVLRFLGVPRQDLRSKHVKIHTRPLRDSITNWDDVYRALNGTEFESLLHDRDYL